MKFLGLLSLVALASAAPSRSLLKRDDSTTCGSTSYSADAVSAAANAACFYVQNGEEAGSSDYPHQYKDYEGFYFGGLSGPFYEFPILSYGEVYSGGSPGADRVIVDSSCDIAGVITHQGASGDDFVACSGTS